MRARITASVAGILILTLTAHYLAFRLARLPLPMSRTGIFFLPLCTLLIALVAAILIGGANVLVDFFVTAGQGL